MRKLQCPSLFVWILFLLGNNHIVFGCSMYKVTADGKTMVGCNQDAWRTTTCIWFETKSEMNAYGACFTGSRKVGPNQFVPQSGMNEKGLVFSRLTAYHPSIEVDNTGKKSITNEVTYLSDILHQCSTIQEVREYVEQFDHSYFIDDVFIYVDQSGAYLIVEPYQTIEGKDSTYVLANFCPSRTNPQAARKQLRYKHGEDYLSSHRLNASLEFCRTVSDTMSVCRNRNGDGTLLTSIWDTQQGLVNIYFYHAFDSTIQYNLQDELEKGNHLISIPELFPVNLEFERLIQYQTPFNNNPLRVAIASIGGIMFLLSLLYLINFWIQKKKSRLKWVQWFMAGLNILLFGYLFVLDTHVNIFYFDAPYRDYQSKLVSLSSYIPFVLLLVIFPITYSNIRTLRSDRDAVWIKSTLVFNNLIYLLLLIGFGYWGLFEVIY